MTLYNELSCAQQINFKVGSDALKVELPPMHHEMPVAGEHPNLQSELLEEQKYPFEVFDRYMGNQILRDAIIGTKSVYQSLEEMSVVKDDLRFFMPRKRDNVWNKRLDQLGALVGDVSALKCDGILAFDNPVVSTIYGALLGCLLPLTSYDGNFAKYCGSIALGCTLGFYSGFFAVGFKRGGILPFYPAQIIDEKIKEMYTPKIEDKKCV